MSANLTMSQPRTSGSLALLPAIVQPTVSLIQSVKRVTGTLVTEFTTNAPDFSASDFSAPDFKTT